MHVHVVTFRPPTSRSQQSSVGRLYPREATEAVEPNYDLSVALGSCWGHLGECGSPLGSLCPHSWDVLKLTGVVLVCIQSPVQELARDPDRHHSSFCPRVHVGAAAARCSVPQPLQLALALQVLKTQDQEGGCWGLPAWPRSDDSAPSSFLFVFCPSLSKWYQVMHKNMHTVPSFYKQYLGKGKMRIGKTR